MTWTETSSPTWPAVSAPASVAAFTASLRQPLPETADPLREFVGWIARQTVHPQPRRAGKGHDTHAVLRLKLAGEYAQTFLNDVHAVGSFHGAGVVEKQNEIQRPAGLASARGGHPSARRSACCGARRT